jgi:hypothetical protein
MAQSPKKNLEQMEWVCEAGADLITCAVNSYLFVVHLTTLSVTQSVDLYHEVKKKEKKKNSFSNVVKRSK